MSYQLMHTYTAAPAVSLKPHALKVTWMVEKAMETRQGNRD